MTATPPDPNATRHDSTPDLDDKAPVDAQTLLLREENRALRELLAAQAQANAAPMKPRGLRQLCWWLISAPGAALVGWRNLIGCENAPRITGRRVGSATLTVLYTLAIYGALVLLVVSWSSPNSGISGSTAAGLIRVPLTPQPANSSQDAAPELRSDDPTITPADLRNAATTTDKGKAVSSLETTVAPAETPRHPPREETAGAPPPVKRPPHTSADVVTAAGGPQPTLRITEIPAQNPLAWVDSLKGELARCAALGFFERPECAWAARNQFCEPNRGWGAVKECPPPP